MLFNLWLYCLFIIISLLRSPLLLPFPKGASPGRAGDPLKTRPPKGRVASLRKGASPGRAAALQPKFTLYSITLFFMFFYIFTTRIYSPVWILISSHVYVVLSRMLTEHESNPYFFSSLLIYYHHISCHIIPYYRIYDVIIMFIYIY